MFRSHLAALALTAALVPASAALAQTTHPFAYEQPSEGSDFFVVVEIPAGGMTKYEIDAETGHVFVDRYMSMPVVYPANYGSVPSSAAEDGDPLDALVITREPIVPGALIKVRAIGIMNMIDGGEQDDKIVAVPASDIDPTFDEIQSMDDLPQMQRDRMEAFFRVYKNLPEGGDEVELNGFSSAEDANQAVSDAIASYRDGNS